MIDAAATQQLNGWLLGRLTIEEPDVFSLPFVHDADALYVVRPYEVIRQMQGWELHLVHGEVDDRMFGFSLSVRLLKRLLYLLPLYRYAGSPALLVFER